MGSMQIEGSFRCSPLPETSCAYLLQELNMIWDEVGQEKEERERTLEELESECLEAYKRKVDHANVFRAKLHQALAESETKFTNLLLSLGERSSPARPERLTGTLKEQLDLLTPVLQEMQLRKESRVRKFKEIQENIQNITSEIEGNLENNVVVVVNESNLSMKKLDEFQCELQRLKKEKSDRLRKIEEYKKEVHELAITMEMDPLKLISEVDSTLSERNSKREKSRNISDSILSKLKTAVEKLNKEKRIRTQKIQGLEKSLTRLWNILDTNFEERQPFINFIFSPQNSEFSISSSVCLTLDKIKQIESEVMRLDQLKSRKMKELFWKKRTELEEICKKSHMELPPQSNMDNIMSLIISGKMEHEELLKTMDDYMLRGKEEAASRKEIMDKVDKWIASCEEEHWLEEYNMDEKRFSVSRGAHKNLRRAERARIMVTKIPGLVEILMIMTRKWEEERKKTFYYDELPLLAMLNEYTSLRKEKEDEKWRQRERKKAQAQMKVQSARPMTSSSRPASSSNRGFNTSSNSQYFSSKKISSTNRTPRVPRSTVNKRNLHNSNADMASEISVLNSVPPSP